jgi:flavodoxin
MKSLIVCYSYHHNNTQKVAQAIAGVIGAEVKTPQQVNLMELASYELVGFGSGIYMSKPHKELLSLADKLPEKQNQKTFIFSTSGQPNNGEKFHRSLREKLQAKGYRVVGEFNCTGFDTFGPFKLVGGLQKGHPNEDDLKAASVFAETLKVA